MPDIHCIPVNLFPAEALKFNQCSVIPGLIIKKYEGQLKKKIDDFLEKEPQLLKVYYSHLIYIDVELYLTKLKERLITEGKEFPEQPPSPPPFDFVYINSFPLAKQAIMALILSGPVSFSMQGIFVFSRNGNQFQLKSYSPSPAQHFEVPFIIQSAMATTTKVSAKQIMKHGMLLDQYYREGIWSIDRYAMALTHFWGALCTQFVDQSLLGFTTTLECLLSTSNIEITHMLAERCALILKETPNDRLAKYDEVKKIYDYRSKLVHGKAFVKKGRIDQKSLCISPKIMNVPVSIIHQAFNIALDILIAILNNKKLISIIRKESNEDQISKELNSFFISALFNSS